jgi:hypothetical protein
MKSGKISGLVEANVLAISKQILQNPIPQGPIFKIWYFFFALIDRAPDSTAPT